MAVKIIYFVHGTTTDNLEKLATGWLPGELSEKGISQSIALREHINFDEIDLVITSDLKRAIDSAKYVYENKKTVLNDWRIRECNYGDLDGKSASLIKYEEHINDPFINGEALVDVEKRVRDFCDYLLENYDNKTIAIVAHRAPQLAFEVITMNKTWEGAIRDDWRNTKAWQPGWRYELKKN